LRAARRALNAVIGPTLALPPRRTARRLRRGPNQGEVSSSVLAAGAAGRSTAIGSVEVSHDPLDSVSSSRSWIFCARFKGGADATRRATVLPMSSVGEEVVPSVGIADRPPLDRPPLDRPRGGADSGLGDVDPAPDRPLADPVVTDTSGEVGGGPLRTAATVRLIRSTDNCSASVVHCCTGLLRGR
jgi:hypothetical protein